MFTVHQLLASSIIATVESPDNADHMDQLLWSVIYSGVGVVVFAIALFLMVKLAPFSVVKEIEEDQNTSLGIIIGSVMIGLAIIISAAIT